MAPTAAEPDYAIRAIDGSDRRWLQLLRESPQATLFHSPVWLEATGVPFQLYGVFKGEELRAGLALGTPAPGIAGHPEPALTPYLGLLLPPDADRVVNTQSTNKAITAAAAAFLQQEFSSVHLRFPPEILDLQPFIWRGYQAGVRYTYRLGVSDLDAALAGMDATRRRNLRGAEQEGLTIESPAPLSTVLALADRTFARQGKDSVLRDGATRIAAALAPHHRCRAFVANDAMGRPVGGVWIVWDDRRAYYLVGGYDDAADSANATALAMWSAVRFTSEVLHLPVFDFEGSMVPAVERFFRKFGGALLPTYTVSWTRPVSTPTRIARRVRRLVARD